MKVAILQSSYVPWRGYFDLINDVDVFVFYDCVKYTKNDWRNRNTIYTKNGKQWLTIPVSAESVKLAIDEVFLPDSWWQKKHAKTLAVGYGRAPCFSQVDEIINAFLVDHRWTSLSQLNQHLIEHISRRLGCSTVFHNARDFHLAENRVERLVGILQSLGAKEYVSGPSAAAYLSGKEDHFHEAGIRLTYKKYLPYREYRQIRRPHEPAVSILDLVANIPWAQIPDYIWAPTSCHHDVV